MNITITHLYNRKPSDVNIVLSRHSQSETLWPKAVNVHPDMVFSDMVIFPLVLSRQTEFLKTAGRSHTVLVEVLFPGNTNMSTSKRLHSYRSVMHEIKHYKQIVKTFSKIKRFVLKEMSIVI